MLLSILGGELKGDMTPNDRYLADARQILLNVLGVNLTPENIVDVVVPGENSVKAVLVRPSDDTEEGEDPHYLAIAPSVSFDDPGRSSYDSIFFVQRVDGQWTYIEDNRVGRSVSYLNIRVT